MTLHFRPVTPDDLEKFPIWYERIGGPELFTHFIPSTFVSFRASKDVLWFIILDDAEEIGTVWLEKKDPDKTSRDLGIYLNRSELFGKGIGGKVIQSMIDRMIRAKDVRSIYLDVRQNNKRALRCYERMGFETVYEAEKITDWGRIKFKRMKRAL